MVNASRTEYVASDWAQQRANPPPPLLPFSYEMAVAKMSEDISWLAGPIVPSVLRAEGHLAKGVMYK